MEVREIARLYPQWVKVEIVCALSPCAVNLDAAVRQIAVWAIALAPSSPFVAR